MSADITAENWSTTLKPDVAWAAVAARDRGSDGRFVYAVTSTGVYCRPSCPSRRPARRHVCFFPGPEEARRAGFRPCRRCHPDAPLAPGMPVSIRRAVRYLDAHVGDRVTLADLSRVSALSPSHVQRLFRRLLGLSPREYQTGRRAEAFRKALVGGADVTTATYAAGYGSPSRVYERAKSRLGMTPAAYRAGGAGARIEYSTVGTSLGRMIVAATGRGVCAVRFGSSDGALRASLLAECPRATLAPGGRAFARWVREIVRRVDGGEPRLEVPLDLRATAFQYRVWSLLQKIPPGTTQTYAEVARDLGDERAARAVGRACAANPAAVVVPCHRVVPAAGGVGGYRWGVTRKRALLAAERRGLPVELGRHPAP